MMNLSVTSGGNRQPGGIAADNGAMTLPGRHELKARRLSLPLPGLAGERRQVRSARTMPALLPELQTPKGRRRVYSATSERRACESKDAGTFLETRNIIGNRGDGLKRMNHAGNASAGSSVKSGSGRRDTMPSFPGAQRRSGDDEREGSGGDPGQGNRQDQGSSGSYRKAMVFNAVKTLTVNGLAYYAGQFSAAYARRTLADNGWDARSASAMGAMVNQGVQMFARSAGNIAAKYVQFGLQIPRIVNQSNTWQLEAIKGFVVSAAADQAGVSAKIPIVLGAEGNIIAGAPISATADAIASIANDLLATRQRFQPSLADPARPDCQGNAHTFLEQGCRRPLAAVGAASLTLLTGNRNASVLGVSIGSGIGGLLYRGATETISSPVRSEPDEESPVASPVTQENRGTSDRLDSLDSLDRIGRLGRPNEFQPGVSSEASRVEEVRFTQSGNVTIFDSESRYGIPAEEVLRAELVQTLTSHEVAHVQVDGRALGFEAYSMRFDGQLSLRIREVGAGTSTVEVYVDDRSLGWVPLADLAKARVDDEPVSGSGSASKEGER